MTNPSLDWMPAGVRERSIVRKLEAGQTLFRQGDKASAIFEVEQGRVQLIRQTVDDHPVVMHTALPGHLFAEAALFAGAYQCDAVAPVTALVRAYAKHELLASLRADPAMAERFMAALAHQVHALRARLEERNIRSARQRALHHLSLRAGGDGRTMRLNGTLVELAAEIGSAHPRGALPDARGTRKGRNRPAHQVRYCLAQAGRTMISIIQTDSRSD